MYHRGLLGFEERKKMSVTNVVFKDGVQLPLEVWQHSHMRNIIRAAMIEAPQLVDDTLVVTSVSRGQQMRMKPFSYHQAGEEGRAVDFRTGLSGTSRDTLEWENRIGAIDPSPFEVQDRYRAVLLWAQRIRERLGNEYDVIYGIEHNHVDHIHVEHDRKKELGDG